MTERRASFLRDLFRQLASSAPRIDAGRWCAHNAFLGTILLGGALVLRFSAPPDVLGARGFAFVVASAGALLAAAVLPLVRPTLVPALLAADGLLVIALTVAFSIGCIDWARYSAGTRSFRYLPGLITTAMTYGSALWADFGPDRAHARPWRRAGFILGIALDAVVGALVIAAAMRA
jgi:DNA-binding transcriptional regulator of glucitol operon